MGALHEGLCLDELANGLNLEGAAALNGVELRNTETAQIEDAVRVLLQGLGDDVNRGGIRKTPLRVAKALKEGTTGYQMKVMDIVQDALFPERSLDGKVGQAGGTGGLVIVRDLDLYSYCESCLLPFPVKCHVGYVPSGQRILGLSKLSRVSDVFAKRLQDPQRLANEICSALQLSIKPAGVAVLLQCSHIQIPSLESISLESTEVKGCVEVIVSSVSGVFENKRDGLWSDFMSLLRFKGLNLDGLCNEQPTHWCPSKARSVGTADSAMVNAVSSILLSLGENPYRKELMETPNHFVKWLLKFKNTTFDIPLNGFSNSTKLQSLNLNGDVKPYKKTQLVLNLPFWSLCEHHLLPFNGVVHIGYICSGELGVGLPMKKALLQSIVHFYGLKLQVQERLTKQIAETISPLLGQDVIVVVEANHTCMISRGIQKFGSSTATLAALGRFSTDTQARASFLERIFNGHELCTE